MNASYLLLSGKLYSVKRLNVIYNFFHTATKTCVNLKIKILSKHSSAVMEAITWTEFAI